MCNIAKLLKTKLGNLIKLSHARTFELTQISPPPLTVIVKFVFIWIKSEKTSGGSVVTIKVVQRTGFIRVCG